MREGCGVIFKSHEEFLAARNQYRKAKGDRSAEGKKLAAARAKLYASLHPTKQGEFEPPCTDMDMEKIIIDPLHCLLLNLPKVVWKYTFGDRMTNEQRELVAEYLTSIGCPLDVRAKGDGRDANRKWFTGEIFQRFVEGGGESPGLAENIKAIMDIIYLKAPAPVEVPAVPAPEGSNNLAAAVPAPEGSNNHHVVRYATSCLGVRIMMDGCRPWGPLRWTAQNRRPCLLRAASMRVAR